MSKQTYFQTPKMATFPLVKFRTIKCETVYCDQIISGSSYQNVQNYVGNRGFAWVQTGDAIPHGLGAVPSFVGLTMSGSIPVFFSYTFDSTYIYLHDTMGGLHGVYWLALP